ncbi:response regulator [Fodinibius sediminis]|uniref:Response regulator receiver domain-containing protein n=1 Tax=Fodinibius sediminis TaxID=1214077 RepID=A0A521BI23_9BACT|nr:response regulator [Fodinibius sediminis]SMO46745.1 Response regulator receiver domain-containing protein [Fodinibius sediminis]
MQQRAILIADQEEAVSDSLELVLSDEGYRCFTSSSKSEILDILQAEAIAIVILDSQLAMKTGLPQIIKARYPSVKSIIISSYAALESIQLALMDSTSGIILKPLDFDELIRLVKRMITPAGR